ncbi:MAG: ketoacyl-ACP synthase III [Lachnospiraceae bacterium]|jgi:3-oxoacyl-[acyl-carrier-protein] synthase-3|nr:ketoacyl-ACP synthase III [Lachnospiraceae bacterium]
MTTRIIGTGSALPETVVTNEYLSTIMDTSDEWITTRTGIRERRLVKTETTASLSIQAATRAMTNAGIMAQDIELIIVATLTGDYLTPSTACEVQAAIGADRAVVFDVNAACSGFLYALNIAHAFLQSGMYNNALIIGVEVLSKMVDWSDRRTCVLFGDGAGAAIVKRDEVGIIACDLGADGAKGKALICQDRVSNNPVVSNKVELGFVEMDGQEVYKFAVSTVPISIEKVLGQAGLKAEDIDLFVFHQANIRIIQAVAKRLGISEDRFPINIDHCGNISAASVPILLDEINQKGMLKRGDRIMLVAFGGGLTWGTTIMVW